MTPSQIAELFENQSALLNLLSGQSAKWQGEIDAYRAGAVRLLYIDLVDGNDINDGAFATPVKSIARARQLTPAGVFTVWYLSPSNGAFEYDATDNADRLVERRLAIQPRDPVPPAVGSTQSPVPTLRFMPRPIGAAFGSSGFTGGGKIWFHQLKVETAAGVAGQSFYVAGAMSPGVGGRDLNLTLSYCALTLREQDLVTVGDGGFSQTNLIHSGLYETGVGVQGKLLRLNAAEAAQLNVVNCTLPAGRKVKDLLAYAPTPLDADGKPRSLLTNVSWAA